MNKIKTGLTPAAIRVVTEEEYEQVMNSYHDLSDIPPQDLERVHEGFRPAYETADLIMSGHLDPLRGY